MRLVFVLSTLSVGWLLVGCGDDARPDSGAGDGGSGGDMTVMMMYDLGPRVDGCVPSVEICGDRMDQNCDGRDTSCGDTDVDGIMACAAGDDLTMCDCDDSRVDVRPPRPGLAGAPEICDGRDNDCNTRVDEHSECCSGCASLGTDRERADICTEAGECDCSTEPGIGACAEGETCCGGGCTDIETDFMNCGFCNAACTDQADNCGGGECRCGDGPVCDFITMCSGGSC